jgi:hypothetical protein
VQSENITIDNFFVNFDNKGIKIHIFHPVNLSPLCIKSELPDTANAK